MSDDILKYLILKSGKNPNLIFSLIQKLDKISEDALDFLLNLDLNAKIVEMELNQIEVLPKSCQVYYLISKYENKKP